MPVNIVPSHVPTSEETFIESLKPIGAMKRLRDYECLSLVGILEQPTIRVGVCAAILR